MRLSWVSARPASCSFNFESKRSIRGGKIQRIVRVRHQRDGSGGESVLGGGGSEGSCIVPKSVLRMVLMVQSFKPRAEARFLVVKRPFFSTTLPTATKTASAKVAMFEAVQSADQRHFLPPSHLCFPQHLFTLDTTLAIDVFGLRLTTRGTT